MTSVERLALRLGALMRRLFARYRREPAAVNALVAAVVGLGSTLGLNLPQGAGAALMAVLAATAGLVTRAQVTPVARPPKTVATRARQRDLARRLDESKPAAVQLGQALDPKPRRPEPGGP